MVLRLHAWVIASVGEGYECSAIRLQEYMRTVPGCALAPQAPTPMPKPMLNQNRKLSTVAKSLRLAMPHLKSLRVMAMPHLKSLGLSMPHCGVLHLSWVVF